MSTVKRKQVSLGEKYKPITELESGIKPSKVAEKYDVFRNTVSTWLKKKKKSISKDAQADAVEEIDDPFKSLQSDLDELRLLDQSLVPDGTTAEDYTDTDKNLVVTESVLIDDEEILGQYRETPNVDVDDDTEENTEEVEPPNKPSRSEIYAAMELLQKCSLFEEEEVAFNMRRHLEKFNVIYDKSQEMKKQQTTIKNFFHRL